MLVLLYLFCINPVEVISLDQEFNRIRCYNDHVYCAPFLGKSIFKLTETRNFQSITFTDDENYRIYDFRITPFSLYIQSGMSIQQFYLISGATETIYSSQNITAFSITTSEEVVLADRDKRELVFLDFTNNVRFTISDVKIKDLQIVDNKIYALTNTSIIVYDEHGNILQENDIPETFSRISVNSSTIFSFSYDKKYFYVFNNDWHKIEFPPGVSDICTNKTSVLILDGSGTNLYIYNTSQIK